MEIIAEDEFKSDENLRFFLFPSSRLHCKLHANLPRKFRSWKNDFSWATSSIIFLYLTDGKKKFNAQISKGFLCSRDFFSSSSSPLRFIAFERWVRNFLRDFFFVLLFCFCFSRLEKKAPFSLHLSFFFSSSSWTFSNLIEALLQGKISPTIRKVYWLPQE